jgi:hypothetical protein
LIVLVVAPLHNDTDFDLGYRKVHQAAAPIEKEGDWVTGEHDAVVQIEVSRFHNSVAVEIHLYAVSGCVQDLDTGHQVGIRWVAAN